MYEKLNFDERHNVRELPLFRDNSYVYVDDGYYCNKRGRVARSADQPRSYLVDVSSNRVTRNRKFLKPSIDHEMKTDNEIVNEPLHADQNDNASPDENDVSRNYVTRSGCISKPPHRLCDFIFVDDSFISQTAM